MNKEINVKDRIIIITLVQLVIYSAIWLWNEYVAFYITIILPATFLILLLFSLMADWIEPSRVPGWYYFLMIISIISPLVIGIIFFLIYKGRFDFLL